MTDKTRLYWEGAKKVHAVLFALHPELFSLENPKPLRLGIFREIKARYPKLQGHKISAFLNWFTIRRAYLINCTVGSPRYSLTGEIIGEVAAKEAEYALNTFRARNAAARDKWPLQIEKIWA